jgi:nucleoside-specific outer membrane channel protein Tsx
MNALRVAFRLKSAAVAAAITLAALLAPAAARAEFGTTNFQLLQGWSFTKDANDANSTADEKLTTITINHFHTWAYGDNFFFADLARGKFGGAKEVGSGVYAEWHPRLFLNKLLGTGSVSIIKNWGLAGEVNQGAGFYAYLGGLGLDLAIPGFQVAGLNLFYRYENFALHTWQVSPYWDIPFALGPVKFLFSGFADFTTNRDGDLDIMTQPELLVDLGAFAGSPGKLHAGVELYLHKFTDFTGKGQTVVAPQLMVQWTPFTQFVP